MADPNSKPPRRPVSEQDFNQHLDELFEGKDPQRYQRIEKTLRQMASHGLDYSRGNPLRRSLAHLSALIDQRFGTWREQGALPRSLRSEDLEAWGKKIEEWAEQIDQQPTKRKKRR